MQHNKNADKLLSLIDTGVSSYHTVYAVKKQLDEAGYKELALKDEWGLIRGGKYYMVHHDSCLIAFAVGSEFSYRDSFRIAAAHTDTPCLQIKHNPEMSSQKYAQLNVEAYGGAILNTWLDRPLSAAGRVVLKSAEIFRPSVRLVDFKKPLFMIPNLAIHLNRKVNEGMELNKQTDMSPIVGMVEEMLNREGFFMQYLADELDVGIEDILDYEINLYNADVGDVIGMNEEFISAPRLDDLTSVQAITTGLIEGRAKKDIHVGVYFDHEEIGSRSKQGAGSTLLSMVLEKIVNNLGLDRGKYIGLLQDSLLLSVDVAHAVHPNQAAKSDPTNKAYLNKGLCIKEASSQSYATDSEIIGIVQQICEQESIPYQKLTNRSDATGGSTLGSIASALLPVRTIDIGIPLLAMHSSREFMGTRDQTSLVHLLKAFYSL